MTDPLRAALDDLAGTVPVPGADRVTRVRKAARRRRVVQGSAVVAAVAIAVAGIAFALPSDGPSRTAPATPEGEYVMCGALKVPVSRLDDPGHEESAPGAQADGLRKLLADPALAYNTGATGETDWLTLAETDDTVTFGHRVGAVGVGSVLSLTRQPSGTWTLSGYGDCGPVHVSPTQLAARIESYSATGATLSVTWSTGACDPQNPVPDDVEVRTETHVEADGVHVRVITQRNPDAGPPGQACAGVGLTVRSSVTLDAPLGTQKVWDDAALPPKEVVLRP